MTNINGKAYAMNAVTPMKPWKTPLLRIFFFILGLIKPLQKDLKDLSFIHFARWVVVSRHSLPHLSERQPREELQYDYLLFFSNFNGTWNQYIDAFSAALYHGLDAIWMWSEKYPGARPVTALKQYIGLVQFDTDYYYNVYPHSATNDVKAALRVQEAFTAFARTSQSLSPEEFGKAWLALEGQGIPRSRVDGDCSGGDIVCRTSAARCTDLRFCLRLSKTTGSKSAIPWSCAGI